MARSTGAPDALSRAVTGLHRRTMAHTPAALLALTLLLDPLGPTAADGLVGPVGPLGAVTTDRPLAAVLAGARLGAQLGTGAVPHGGGPAAATRAQGWPRGWRWPLSPRPEVVHPFTPPPEPWASGHRGVDLLGQDGEPVLAAGAGVVAFSGVIAGRGVVAIAHHGGWRTTYEPVRARLPRGADVVAGEAIGRLDTTGSHCAPRACLHWGALTGRRDYHDPLTLLGLTEPVLLPLSG